MEGILDSLDFPAPQSRLGTSLAQLVPIPGSPYPAAVIEDELIGVIYATRVSSLVTDGGTSVLLGTTSLYQYSSQWWYSAIFWFHCSGTPGERNGSVAP